MCLDKIIFNKSVNSHYSFILAIPNQVPNTKLNWFNFILFGVRRVQSHEYWRLNVCLTVFLNTLLTGIPYSSETLFKTLNSSLSKLMVVLWKPLFWWIDFFWSWWLSNMDIPVDWMVKIQSLRCVCDFIS